jgi:hypothetical protein
MVLSLMLARPGESAPPSAPPLRAVTDPFGYCARVVTEDRLGVASSNEEITFLAPHLRNSLGLSADAPVVAANVFWRCMHGKVYACAVGANLPCASKADRATHNRGAANFCREHPDAVEVAAYATGHDTVYAWRCAAGAAVRGAAVATLDERGFRTDIWHAVSK